MSAEKGHSEAYLQRSLKGIRNLYQKADGLYQTVKSPALRFFKPVGGLVFATVFAISHHFLHHHYDQTEVNENTQFVIKAASNGLSQLVVVCLAMSTTHTLILSTWETSNRPTVASTINNLFSLPDILPILSLIKSMEIRLVVLLALFIQLLAIITTLVPNSLSVVSTSSSVEQVVVPTLDLTQGDVHAVARGVGDPTYGLWTGLTNNHRKLVWQIMVSPSDSLWLVPPPPICGAYCNFGMRFVAPTLQCQDSSGGGWSLPPSGNVLPLYQANSSLLTGPFVAGSGYRYDINSTYDLIIHYQPLNNSQTNPSNTGVVCQFQQSIVQSTVQFTDSQPFILTNITYDQPLGGNQNCTWTPGQEMPSCWAQGVNTRALCQAFVEAFSGSVQFDTNSGSRTNVTVGDQSVFDLVFGEDSTAFGLDLAMKDLGSNLEQAFLGVIFGMIQHRNDTTTVQLVLARHTVWEYNPSILAGIYVSFILLALLISLHGLHLMKGGETIPTDRDFTTVIFTSRGRGLHRVCRGGVDFLKKEMLYYDYDRDGSDDLKLWLPSGGPPPRDDRG